jgi:hypothetical protein
MQALLDELARDPAAARRRWLPLVAVALVAAGLATALNGVFTREPDDVPYPGQPDPLRFQRGIAMAWAPEWGSAVTRASWSGFDAASLDQIVGAGATATSVRFDWSRIEPVRGTRDWSYADQQVAAVEQRGLEPFAQIGDSPPWLADPAAGCAEFRNPPSDARAHLLAFTSFYKALSKRYCTRVKYYAFWDEPNGCAWMSCGCERARPPIDTYAFWLYQWYQAMRDGCSDVVLAVGALDCRWGADPDRPATSCRADLERLYREAPDAFDAVALRADGYSGDLPRALGDDQVLNWNAIRDVSATLARHDHAGRRLWIAWRSRTGDERLQARRVTSALTGLRRFPSVFEAQYATLADLPEPEGAPGRPGRSSGLASVDPANARFTARPAWRAFRDVALGPDTTWHGPDNPGMEFQGQSPSEQFSRIPSWGPWGGWQSHNLSSAPGNAVLGRKFGFYAATTERFRQTLGDTFEADRRYCFRSAAQGGRDDFGIVPYQIGYIDDTGREIMLGTSIAIVGPRWWQLDGVCHAVIAGSPEIGRRIWVGFGSALNGGTSDIWFDNLQVTSVAVNPAR